MRLDRQHPNEALSMANTANNFLEKGLKDLATASLCLGIMLGSGVGAAFADTAASTVSTKYDGFAEYAKENQMEKSDVGCFINKCGDQTKNLFSNPRGIKGVSW